MVRKVFLVGFGCFNPPTIMHLRMFEIGRDCLESLKSKQFQVLGGILSPAHDKYAKKGLLPSTHRLPMAKLALTDQNFVNLSSWECQQEGWSRSRAVLDAYAKQLGDWTSSKGQRPEWVADKIRPDDVSEAGLMLLCGDDLLESFNTPGVWSNDDIRTIVEKYGIVVLSRGGTKAQEFIYQSDQLYEHKNNIYLALSSMGTDISSTKIRLAVRRKHSIRYLVHELVIEYISKHNLYASQPDNDQSGATPLPVPAPPSLPAPPTPPTSCTTSIEPAAAAPPGIMTSSSNSSPEIGPPEAYSSPSTTATSPLSSSCSASFALRHKDTGFPLIDLEGFLDDDDNDEAAPGSIPDLPPAPPKKKNGKNVSFNPEVKEDEVEPANDDDDEDFEEEEEEEEFEHVDDDDKNGLAGAGGHAQSADGVQFEITPKGVKVISEKESYL